MKNFVISLLRLSLTLAIVFTPFSLHAEPPSDEQKLKWILGGQKGMPTVKIDKAFKPEGVITAVGRLVAIGGSIYFKTADQTFLPKGQTFPYPELFFELQPTQTHAYQSLLQQGILKGKTITYNGPLRIKGNWAYERASANFSSGHYFGLVWVDEASKVAASPEGDWSDFEKQVNAVPPNQQSK